MYLRRSRLDIGHLCVDVKLLSAGGQKFPGRRAKSTDCEIGQLRQMLWKKPAAECSEIGNYWNFAKTRGQHARPDTMREKEKPQFKDARVWIMRGALELLYLRCVLLAAEEYGLRGGWRARVEWDYGRVWYHHFMQLASTLSARTGARDVPSLMTMYGVIPRHSWLVISHSTNPGSWYCLHPFEVWPTAWDRANSIITRPYLTTADST